MNHRDRDLDRHITGNWGEDQYKESSDSDNLTLEYRQAVRILAERLHYFAGLVADDHSSRKPFDEDVVDFVGGLLGNRLAMNALRGVQNDSR